MSDARETRRMRLAMLWKHARIRVAVWILPAGWGPCVTGKANPPREGYVDVYGNWHPFQGDA
jgi:hypothetical protein